MDYTLSKGSIDVIMNGGLYEKPVLQVLSHKTIPGRNENERLWEVSDGEHVHFAIMTTKYNKDILGDLPDYSIIQIKQYDTIALPNIGKAEMKIIEILDLRILKSGTDIGIKLGNPQIWSEKSAPTIPAQNANKLELLAQASHTPTGTWVKSASDLNSKPQHINSIASLNPKKCKWIIKAYVVNKTDKCTWKNNSSSGKRFSMVLCDDSGNIYATAFGNECDKFYDKFQVNKVYYISGCKIVEANKKYKHLKNPYDMIFTSETVIEECMEDSSSIPKVKYDFLLIRELIKKDPDSIIDTIAVCREASDLQELGRNGKSLKKREITLVDQSGAITLVLWNNQAENFNSTSNPVIAIKGARLSEFNSIRSLSCRFSTELRSNPDLPEARRLRDWHAAGGACAELVNISARECHSFSGGEEWMTLLEVQKQNLGIGDKGDYFSILGVLSDTFSDNVVYKACPQDRCRKKLIEQDNSQFLCKSCKKEYSYYKDRILLNGILSDPTSDRKFTAFNDVAEVILGKTAEQVARILRESVTEYVRLFQQVQYKLFVFKLRSVTDIFKNERILKTTVISAQPVDYKIANARIVKNIKTLVEIEV